MPRLARPLSTVADAPDGKLMDAQERTQAHGPLLLPVAFAPRDLWNGSQRRWAFVAHKVRSTRTPLLLERSGPQASKGT